MKKLMAVAIILLLIGMSIPSTGNMASFDDTTPPVTTYTLDPPEPDGDNGWYVSDVTVTLNATDDMSGVNATYYRINEEEWETYAEPFVIQSDGHCLIEFYSVDNAGNKEDVKSAEIKVDQTPPEIELWWEAFRYPPEHGKWYILFTANATDETSIMNRVEFYIDDKLQETITGPGPSYEWTTPYNRYAVRGIMWNLEITEEYVRFYAIIVRILEFVLNSYICFEAVAYDNAGNSASDAVVPPSPLAITPGLYMFQYLTLPNNYEGYIGRFLIFADFCDELPFQ